MKNTLNPTIFLTLVGSPRQVAPAQLLIDSIRAFGGPQSDSPIWVFEADPKNASCAGLAGEGVQIHPLDLPSAVKGYYFAGKVYANAVAEGLAAEGLAAEGLAAEKLAAERLAADGPPAEKIAPGSSETSQGQSLVWVSTDCLIIQPPVLFDLGQAYDAALRPVHIRNVGLRAEEPLNDYWKRVYQAVGVDDVKTTVVSFVDAARLRAYYNSHVLAVNPKLGLLGRWYECFESLVNDRDFQSGPCQDDLHKVFLHQAVLSALVATALVPERLRNLPPDYSYPYNLQERVPPERRAQALNDLVCIAYEERHLYPDLVKDIRIDDPLRAWLAERTLAIR